VYHLWALVFLADGEGGRRHRRLLGGVLVVFLVLVSHAIMSGPWMREAGLSTGSPPAATGPALPTLGQIGAELPSLGCLDRGGPRQALDCVAVGPHGVASRQ
jgi:hypothetical protein